MQPLDPPGAPRDACLGPSTAIEAARGDARRAVLREIVRGAGWPPALVFAAHVAASRVFHAYDRWPRLDIVMHLLGGVAIACCFARAIAILGRERVWLRVAPALLALLVFALTGTAAVFWEFAEFLTDRWAGTTAQLGLEDTLLDLALGIAGGTAYLAGSAALRRKEAP